MNQPVRAVRCGRCGIVYHARHEKCPRCRSRDPRPVSTAGTPAAGPRPDFNAARMQPGPRAGRIAPRTLAAAGAAVILLLAGWTWPSQPPAAATIEPAGPDGPLVRLVKMKQPRKKAVTDRLPNVLPFLETSTAAKLAYTAGDMEAALERFTEQIASRPSDAESHSNAGQVLIRLGRPADALPLLAKAVALDETRWAYRFNLARCHGMLGDWNQAAVEYRAADTLFPNDYATLFNLGQALHRAGREEEAVQRYREAITLRADDPSFLLALGISEERLGHHAEAVAAYREFVAANPDAKEAPGVRLRLEKLEAATPVAVPPAS